MKRKLRRGAMGILLVCAMILGLYQNVPVLAGDTETEAYVAAEEDYWTAELTFCSAVDNFYGNDDEGIVGALTKYYQAMEGDENADTVRNLYNEAVSARTAVVSAYTALETKHDAIEEAYAALTETEKSDIESYQDVKTSWDADTDCYNELETPESPVVYVYWKVLEEFWATETVFCEAAEEFGGNEEKGIVGVVNEYFAAIDSDEDADTVRELYQTVLSAYEAVEDAYATLGEKHTDIESSYGVLSGDNAYETLAAEEKEEISNSYTGANENWTGNVEWYKSLETPEYPGMYIYGKESDAFWEKMNSYWKAADSFYGNEEQKIEGALNKYEAAIARGDDIAKVKKLYDEAVKARDAVKAEYDILSGKKGALEDAYSLLKDEEKQDIDVQNNQDEINNSWTDVESSREELENCLVEWNLADEPTVTVSQGATEITLNTPIVEILEKIALTKEEKEAIYGGAATSISMSIANALPTADEKKLVEDKLAGYTVGQYFDIELMLKVGESSRKITDLTETISMSITIPDSLINKDKERTYSIIRIHNGVATIVDGKYDAASGKITFTTDGFSIYTLVYKDTAVSNTTNTTQTPVTQTTGTTQTTNTTQTTAPKTGDNFPLIELEMLLLVVAVVIGISGKRVIWLRSRR